MADSKITALTSISTSTDPANDPLVIVDVSDTSMAATGTTKKVTLNQLLGASGTATLANATITGDLTVDTSTLKVDSANNKVGIGTTTLASTLTIRGTLQTNADYNLQSYYKDNGSTWLGYHLFRDDGVNYLTVLSAQPWAVLVNGSERYRLASDGVATWSNVGGVAGTAMTLNSNGLGVGVASPATKLDVRGANNANQATFSGTAGRGLLISTRSDSLADDRTVILNAQFATGSLGQLVIQTAGTDRLLVDASGNVGIGVTPSAGKGCLQLSSGINFPATQVASSDANTLDDYEEGTWTPSVGGIATYTTQTGRYVKIGNRVFITLRMTINTIGTGDDYRISGLPFQPAAALAAASVGFFANLKISANFISGYASTASSVITMTGTTAASANITNGIGVFGNGSDIVMSCFYEV